MFSRRLNLYDNYSKRFIALQNLETTSRIPYEQSSITVSDDSQAQTLIVSS
jgi:hypothetical protein